MILQWIHRILKQKAVREQHKLMKLEWKRACLERLIAEAKGEKYLK